jgi:signal transduction histidine kinase
MRVLNINQYQHRSGDDDPQHLQNASEMADVLRANQKLIAIGRLTGSIAHEINNPLEAIANLLYLIEQDTELSSQSRSYLKLAEQELGRVIQISKQTLNFYRETSAPVSMLIRDLLEEVLVLYARRLKEKHIHLSRKYAPSQTVSVLPGEMRQVFSNLIANAIEACPPEGSLWIRVRPASMDGDKKGVRITIADNGSGMEPSVLRKIGRPFLTTKGHHGTGLGLWVTMSILARYGVRWRVRSTTSPGRHGTIFSILMPVEMRPRDNCEELWRAAS